MRNWHHPFDCPRDNHWDDLSVSLAQWSFARGGRVVCQFDRRFLDVVDSSGLRTEVACPRTHHRWVVLGLVDGGRAGWLLAPEARGRSGRFASRWSAMGGCRWPSTCMA